MSNLTRLVRFLNKDHRGAARVRFPVFHTCRDCGGITHLSYDGERVDATAAEAAALALVQQGYLLAGNEKWAGKGRYVSFDGAAHEGHDVDEWQKIEVKGPCRCRQTAAQERAA